jgi:hypothetical protein
MTTKVTGSLTLGHALTRMSLTPVRSPAKVVRKAIKILDRDDRGSTRVLLVEDTETGANLIIEMEPLKWEAWFLATDKPLAGSPGAKFHEGRFTMTTTKKKTTSEPQATSKGQAVPTLESIAGTKLVPFLAVTLGWSFAEIKGTLTALKRKHTDGTIRSQMSRAKNGKVEIPQLSSTDVKTLNELKPKIEAKPTAKAAKKKAASKSKPAAKGAAKKKAAKKKAPAAEKPITKADQVGKTKAGRKTAKPKSTAKK